MFDVEACDDVGLLAQEVAPEADVAERVRALRLEVNRAAVQARLGDPDAARVRLQAALAQARELDHPPTTALVLVELARAVQQGGEPKAAIPVLRAALVEAERGRSDARRVGALDQLARRLADASEIDAAHEALAQADAARARAAASASAELYSELRRGYVEHAAGDMALALAHYTRALQLARAQGPVESDSLYEALIGIGVLEADLQRYDDARAHLHEALALLEELYGRDHPMLAAVLVDIAECDYYEGDLGAAEAGYRRALELRSRVAGPDSPRLLSILNNLAAVDFSRGNYRAALDEFRHVLAIRERVFGVDDVDNARFLANMSFCLGRLGDQRGAYESATRAVELRGTKLGEQHPLTGKAHHAAGVAALRLGDRVGARAHFEAAIRTARGAGSGADAFEPMIGLAEILLAEHAHAELVRMLEPAVAECNELGGVSSECAQLEFAWAQAIVATRPARALELARAALEHLQGEDVAVAEVRTKVVAWLARQTG